MVQLLRPPVVLAHGLLGFAEIAVHGVTVATYFRGVPEHLESLGQRVILTEVPPTGSIAARAEALQNAVRDAVGQEPIHIIAHSMGGLDSRYMISHLDMGGQVLSLTTLGTPHHGSPVVDRGLDLADRLGVLDWLLKAPVDLEAFGDLRTDACARFNRDTPDDSRVRYFSVAGVKAREEMLFGLRFTQDLIEPDEGPNDGLVSSRSARWGEFLGEWNCDHLNLIGWTGPREQLKGYAIDVRPRYEGILDRIQAAVDCRGGAGPGVVRRRDRA